MEFLASVFKNVFVLVDVFPQWILRKRASIASVMAVVAVLGAVAAFRAAKVERDASLLDRRFQEGSMREASVHRELLGRVFENALKYGKMCDLHKNEALQHQLAADRKPKGSAEASSQDLDAQEEFAIARALRPFADFTDVIRWNRGKIQEEIDAHAAGDLSDEGFEAAWRAPATPGTPSSLWDTLNQRIDQHHNDVRRLSLSVVFFVFALGCFTVAQLQRPEHFDARQGILNGLGCFTVAHLNQARHRRQLWLLRLACLIVVVALILALWRDLDSAKTLGLYSALVLPVIISCWQLALFQRVKRFFHLESAEDPEECVHAEELDPRAFAARYVHAYPASHPLHRWVVFLIALTAFLSAGDGYMYSRAAAAASQRANRALEYQVQRVKSNSQSLALGSFLLEELARGQQSRVRFWAGRQWLELAKEGTPGINNEDAIRQTHPWQNFLRTKDDERQLKLWHDLLPESLAPAKNSAWRIALLDGDKGPARDPTFPQKLIADLSWQGDFFFAQWDAQNEICLAWHNRATTYLRVLTLFAIALYLFGQSLTMGRSQAAFIVASCAFWLMMFGVARAVWVKGSERALIYDEKTLDSVAEHYSTGMASFGVAQRPEKFKQAAEELKLAVDGRPTFALAKYYLARSRWMAGTPQTEGYASLTLKGQLKDIVDDQEKAVEILTEQQLSPPVNFLGNYGNDYVLLGLTTADPAAVNHGIEEITKALERDASNPWLLANKGMALLAGGGWARKEEALRSYNEAAEGIKSPAYAAGGISDLRIVEKYCMQLNSRDYCDALHPDLMRLKTKFIRKAWPTPPSLSTPKLKLKITPSPAGLSWKGPVDKIDPTLLVVLVFVCDAPPPYSDACDHDADRGVDYWGVWLVLPGLSGQVDPSLLRDTEENGKYEFRRYFINDQPACLPARKYRAEFYLNDQLVAEDENRVNNSTYEAAFFRDLNLAICHPADWQLWKSGALSDPGLVRGYTDRSDDPQHGVFLFTYYHPRQASDSDASDSGLRNALSFLQSEGFIPTTQLAASRRACLEHRERWINRYDMAGVTVHSRYWSEPDGVVHVVLAFDRRSNRPRPAELTSGSDDDSTDCDMLSSAINIVID